MLYLPILLPVPALEMTVYWGTRAYERTAYVGNGVPELALKTLDLSQQALLCSDSLLQLPLNIPLAPPFCLQLQE